jgi:uncharacterized protein (DUF1330 family)
MSGYVVADVTTVKDPGLYQRYQALVPLSLRAFNGTYLARGGEVTVLEGSWQPRRLVIVLFESVRRQRHGGTRISTVPPGLCARRRQ